MEEAGEQMTWGLVESLAQIEEFGWLAWLDQGILLLCLAWLIWMALLEWQVWTDPSCRGHWHGWKFFARGLWMRIGLFGLPGYLFGMLLDIWWF